MYVEVLIYSLILVAAMWVARWRFGVVGPLVAGFVLGGLLVLGGPPVHVLHGRAAIVVGIGCTLFRARAWVVFVTSIGAMALGYGLWFGKATGELAAIARFRERHPIESIAHRLEFDEPEVDRVPGDDTIALSSEVSQRLDEFEADREWSIRASDLERVHDVARDRFVMARGFGGFRMTRIVPDMVEVPIVEPIDLSPPPPPRDPYAEADSPEPPLFSGDWYAVHRTGIADVFDKERFGYVENRDRVAGFLPHRMGNVPSPDEEFAWRITRLELVSLLRHDGPRVYVSDQLPRMDELGELSTRPVDGFERAALERLDRDEDLVVDAQPHVVRMVGSLRAATDCLKCHSGERGRLLGAFTYELYPLSSYRTR